MSSQIRKRNSVGKRGNSEKVDISGCAMCVGAIVPMNQVDLAAQGNLSNGGSGNLFTPGTLGSSAWFVRLEV